MQPSALMNELEATLVEYFAKRVLKLYEESPVLILLTNVNPCVYILHCMKLM